MQTEEQRRAWIDAASYRDLLAKWRHEPIGSPWFEGALGIYFQEALNKKRKEISSGEAVAASKEVGWW